MASLTISILLGPIIISIFAPGIFCNLCEDEFKVKLDGPEEPDGTIQHQNISYPKEAFWKDGDDIFGCPCLVQFCIRQCTQGKNYINFLEILLNHLKIKIGRTHRKDIELLRI